MHRVQNYLVCARHRTRAAGRHRADRRDCGCRQRFDHGLRSLSGVDVQLACVTNLFRWLRTGRLLRC
jgi:hypothetical protein